MQEETKTDKWGGKLVIGFFFTDIGLQAESISFSWRITISIQLRISSPYALDLTRLDLTSHRLLHLSLAFELIRVLKTHLAVRSHAVSVPNLRLNSINSPNTLMYDLLYLVNRYSIMKALENICIVFILFNSVCTPVNKICSCLNLWKCFCWGCPVKRGLGMPTIAIG